MFRTLALLLLFGSLSPLQVTQNVSPIIGLPDVSPPPIVSSLFVNGDFSASGAIVMDILSGKALFGRREDEPRAIGSLTKLMTAIIILEERPLDDLVTIPRSVEQIGGHIAGLRPGDRYTVRDLLTAMIVASSNDAAYALAVDHSDSIEQFAVEMNKRALSLGMTATHFTNPVGFDHPDQVSTPRELAWMSMYALKNDFIRTMASRKSVTIHDQSGQMEYVLYSTNRLLTSHPGQFFGLKTGTTDAAGQCLISLTYVHGRPYLFVVLKSANRYEDTLELFESLVRESA